MSTSSFQNKTSALFASVSRATITSSFKIYTNVSAMNSLNNNNIINNQQQQQSITMAANTSSSSGAGVGGGSGTTSSSSSGFSKGLSLFASIGCHSQMAAQQSNGGVMTSSTAAAATALNNNNNIYNNNQSEAATTTGTTTTTTTRTTTPVGSSGSGVLSDNVVLSGNLRKLKTMKKKYFVLYRNAPNRPARLEYFDSEKKYRLHANHPKRSIRLEACFNINRRTDTKHKCVIALYTNEDCFCLVCDNESELELWLHKMLSLQNNKDENGEPPKPAFAQVWSVEVQRRGLAEDKGLIGRYHLCLTDKSITLNRYGPATSNGESRLASVEFPMSTVRKGGHLNSVFYMELGRQNVLGAGELWLAAQDTNTAQIIQHSIINASAKPSRPRSQSASQASKPIILRRPTTQGTAQGMAPMNFSPSSSGSSALSGMTGIPENSPNSRAESPNFSTCSSTASTVIPNTSNYTRIMPGCGATSNGNCTDNIHQSAISGANTTPTTTTAAVPEASLNGAHNLLADDSLMAAGDGAAVRVTCTLVQAAVIIGPKDSNINYAGMAIKRERCDSLPSRNRTISDGNASSSLTSSTSTIMPPPKTIPSWNRPVSMCNRPSNSPISPSNCSESDGSSISIDEPDGLPQYSSGTPDDNGGYFHRYAGPQDTAILEESDEYWSGDKYQKRVPGGSGPSRLPSTAAASLSLPIATGGGGGAGSSSAKGCGRNNGDIAGSASPAINSSSAEGHSNYMDMYSPSGSSPLDPTGNGGHYMPMSPSVEVPRSLYTGSSSTHSRASSLTEENLDIGSRYVEMDMSHNLSHASHSNRRHGGGGNGGGGGVMAMTEGGLSSAASSSSITSGTPSTDTRFADYPLEKVYSTFGPDDDENNPLSERPMRAYSVGSRLEHSKRKFRMDHSLSSSLASNSSGHSSSRTRAYSVGSRAKMPRSDQYKSSFVGSPAQIALFNSVQHSPYNTGSMMMMQSPPLSDANNNNNSGCSKKSSSVPMLDSFVGPNGSSSGVEVPNERVTDFMELDFSVISIGKINESDDYVLSDACTPVSQPSLEHDYLNMEPVGGGKAKIIPDGYVEMRPVGLGSSVESATGMANSPVRHHSVSSSNNTPKMLSISQRSNSLLIGAGHEESDYLDMRGKDVTPSITQSPVIKSSLSSKLSGSSSGNEDYLNMAPLNRDLVPVAPVEVVVPMATGSSNVMTSSAEEGYLEMSFSRSNSISAAQTSQSAAEFNAQQENYMKGRKPMTSNRSLPININYNSTVPAPGMTPITPRNNIGPFSKLSSLEEVHSPIQATPGGGGGAGKKSSSQVTTPTMFPFSPASPSSSATGGNKYQSRVMGTSIAGAIGVGEMVTARKILVDGTTGTIKLSEEEQCSPRRKVSTADSQDYVNYEPPVMDVHQSRVEMSRSMSNGTAGDEEVQGDYVLMNPVANLRRKSSGQSSTSNFRPIQSSADQQLMDGAPRQIALNRQLSLSAVSESHVAGGGVVSQRSEEESPYELLRTTSGGGSGSDLSSMLRSSGRKHVTSRPSSVNSDKITSRISNLSLNRPNSANSDRLSTISSSSSSTSTLCGGNSSSSSSTTTLCSGGVGKSESQVKTHSPMLMTRVPSDPSSDGPATSSERDVGLKSLPKINTNLSVDKELHYASLDLPVSTMSGSSSSSLVSLTAPLAKPEDFNASGTTKQERNSGDSSSASSSATTTPSPNVNIGAGGQAVGATVPAFNYAQLDFAKCNAMKQQ